MTRIKNEVEKIANSAVEFVGNGQFARVYNDLADSAIMYIVVNYGNKEKEIMSNDVGGHVPHLEYLGEFGQKTVYKSFRSYPITKYNENAWHDMKVIMRVVRDMHPKLTYKRGQTNASCYNHYCQVIDTIRPLLKDESIADDMYNLIMWAADYCDHDEVFHIDAKRSNFAIDEFGNLILRDLLFFRKI